MNKEKHYKLIVDLWRFWRRWLDQEPHFTLTWWQGCLDEADALWRRYDKSGLAKKIIDAVLEEFYDQEKTREEPKCK